MRPNRLNSGSDDEMKWPIATVCDCFLLFLRRLFTTTGTTKKTSITLHLKMYYRTLLALAWVLALWMTKTAVARERDVSYPPCDNPDGTLSHRLRQAVQPITWITTSGRGACRIAYDDWDYGVCVKPGYVLSGHRPHCGAKVQVSYQGRHLYAKVVDVCGAAHDSPLDCDDIILTKAPYLALGGDRAEGYLRGNITWRFVN
ncbi:hypothetical protein A4X09_0g7456 [Tilletia walkeri]|uniref:RlpA-like protein double-psi beta-barrel domain-containing protein n=1 Tax=Tilletia walkeri TaxID=117179 RepID=A0A8X7N243_9BASI|nr:hypothetical protein A4X09_0g7456 [Tilletia walkeri]